MEIDTNYNLRSPRANNSQSLKRVRSSISHKIERTTAVHPHKI